MPVELERYLDRVARGPRMLVNDCTHKTGQAIEQRRFADVGTADQRQPQGGAMFRLRLALWQVRA